MRNIVLVHLESLNTLNYRLNKEYFPIIQHIESQSVSFSKYYSTATSTLMVLGDIAYGREYINEPFRAMDWKRECPVANDSIFDRLEHMGYSVSALDFPPNGVDVGCMNDNDFIGKKTRLEEFRSIEDYHVRINSVLSGDKPFVLWLCNFISHIDFNQYASTKNDGLSRWSEGYKAFDKEIAYIWDLLSDQGLLENTSVVFYGDHGDDIYSHGMCGGLTHAILPYEHMIHTPLFIYDCRFAAENIDSVISSKDIGDIIISIIESEAKGENDSFSTMINYPKAEYAYARNMFAGQRVREKSFDKGYSVTDGEYQLVVSSKGLAMYKTDMDPMCHNNLLRYFEILDNNSLQKKNVPFRFHFKYLMDNGAYDIIIREYQVLLPLLKDYVDFIYKKGGCENREYEMSFNRVSSIVNNLDVAENDEYPEFDLFQTYFADKKVILYGAGNYGRYCFDKIKDKCNVVAWVDKDYKNIHDISNYMVTSPDSLNGMEYDVFYIALTSGKLMQEVYNEAVQKGIDRDKII